ncbi:MAG: hypothetical protein ACI9MR_000679 [Myxococcota bacterium]|jgi:hypothetical protein
MKRMIIIGAATVGLAFSACDSKKTPAPAEQVVVEVTAAEKAAFVKEAASITEANVEAEAVALLKEIEAELQ